ncbi:MAG: hypothetical protein AB200_03145, partial [Parcubacteria bacterium C7867-005]
MKLTEIHHHPAVKHITHPISLSVIVILVLFTIF